MPNEKALVDIQIDFLKQELDHIATSIGRIDQITQTTKNWAIVTWAGSIALAYGDGSEELQPLVPYTAIIPIIFWFIDAWWRRIQRSFGFRAQKISEFLNSEDLAESLRQGQIVNFTVYDPRATQYRGLKEYESYRTSIKTMLFREVFLFYMGLTFVSIFIGFI